MSKTCLRRLAIFCIPFYMVLTLTLHSCITQLSLQVNTDQFRTNVIQNNSGNITATFQSVPLRIHSNNSALAKRGNRFLSEPIVSPDNTSAINVTQPKFDRNRPIVFLHIGKNGGTSFDKALTPILRNLGRKYVGNKHFDWSYIETIHNADVVVLLREPVARAVSHYYFTRNWAKHLNKGSLSTYLLSPKAMLETRDCWQDGQASVLWLTGKHIANWVGIPKDQVPARERTSLDISELCLLAAKRLESTVWFGIMEDLERSLELLQHQLGLRNKITFPTSNVNKHPKATENETRILASLMPQDIWLYDYAKLLFEARWTFYKTGIYRNPDMPPLPTLANVPCISTRYILLCKKGPLSPLYYVDPDAPLRDQNLPVDVLNELKLDTQFFIKTQDMTR